MTALLYNIAATCDEDVDEVHSTSVGTEIATDHRIERSWTQ